MPRAAARPRHGGLVVTAVLAALLLGVGAPAAYGLWRATTTATATLAGGAVSTPTNLACASITSPRVARLTWNAVTGATSYTVSLVRDQNSQQMGPFTTATNTIDITSGLLGGLSGLLAGATFTATIQPVYSTSAWVGGISAPIKVQLYSVLGGMSCA
jgi:hypothetical protein